jgi:hypothetical protein
LLLEPVTVQVYVAVPAPVQDTVPEETEIPENAIPVTAALRTFWTRFVEVDEVKPESPVYTALTWWLPIEA